MLINKFYIDGKNSTVSIKNRKTSAMFFMIHCEPVIFVLCLPYDQHLNL